jgi:hypothetical protein
MHFRHVLRRLARTPMFTSIAVVTLAVGIGANSAIFSVVNGILLKPLPYRHADELIDLNHTAPGVNFPDADPAPFLYFTYREQGRSFQSLGLYGWDSLSVTGLAEPEDAECLNVTAEILPMLGVQPALGRWFSAKDDAPGSPPTAVLMHGWWQARFGGDRSVLGRPIVVNGVSREVIGVMPADFRFLDRDAALVLPLQFDRNKAILGDFDYPGIARLKPGVTIEQASADIARMIPIALHSFPPSPGLTVKVFEDVRLAPKLHYLKQSLVGDVGRTLWVLMGTLGAVLLIACANVANLLLVRAEGRRHELAIRAALGARWRDIVGVESAGITTVIPTGGSGGSDQVYARDKTYQSVPPLRRLKFVSPGLLATMGNRLIAGRDFTWTDTYQRRPVAMLSENLARELWGDPRKAIGREINANPKDPWREVIGVVGDESEDGVQQKAPAAAYYPLLMDNFDGKASVVLRTVSYIIRSKRAGSQGLLPDVQHAVWSLNASLPLGNVRTLAEIYGKSMARTSFTLVMLAIAGGMALLIGLVGIYGVISYSVSQRTREIGIRMALGARQAELVRMFLAHGLMLVTIGVACGLAGAVAVTRALGSLLFEVNPLDPFTYAVVSIGLIAAAFIASYVPASRATAVDPLEALRAD